MCATMKSTEASPGKGAGSILPITALVLFCMAILALWVAQSQLTALQLAGGETRARELFAAAGTALETALLQSAILLDNEPPDFDDNGRFRVAGPAGTEGGWRYETHIHNETLLPFQHRLVEIEAKALDGSGGVRRQRLQARLHPWLAAIPSAPLIAYRAVSLPGEVSLRSASGDVLAWSGGDFTAPAALLDAPGPLRCPPAGVCNRHGVLAAHDRDAAFEHWFARERDTLRALSTWHADLEWLEADDGTIIEGSADYGSAAAPRLLIVAGDLEVRGMLTMHGLLYVDGTLQEGNGSITVYGAMVIAGDAVHQGPMTIDYQPDALQTLTQRGSYVRIPGSWNDF